MQARERYRALLVRPCLRLEEGASDHDGHRHLAFEDAAHFLLGAMPLDLVFEQGEGQIHQAARFRSARVENLLCVCTQPVTQVVGIGKTDDETSDLLLNGCSELHHVHP